MDLTLPDKVDFKVGDTFRAVIPSAQLKNVKVHITHVIPSSCYSDLTFVLYKVYGPYRPWWNEFMCKTEDMEGYIERGKRKSSITA